MTVYEATTTLSDIDTFTQDVEGSAGDWCLVTAATQLKGIYKTGDTVNVTVRTYGSDTPTRGNSYYTGPTTYITKNINDIVPYVNVNDLSKVEAIPTGGEWLADDVLEMSKPTEERQAPYVCIADGNPGTWV